VNEHKKLSQTVIIQRLFGGVDHQYKILSQNIQRLLELSIMNTKLLSQNSIIQSLFGGSS